jgi:uncharacterized membrane protein YccF (DUF307 family)
VLVVVVVVVGTGCLEVTLHELHILGNGMVLAAPLAMKDNIATAYMNQGTFFVGGYWNKLLEYWLCQLHGIMSNSCLG